MRQSKTPASPRVGASHDGTIVSALVSGLPPNLQVTQYTATNHIIGARGFAQRTGAGAVEVLKMKARAAHHWRLQRGLAYLLCGMLACAFSTLAAGAPYEEDAVKAAFLYRFTGYMEWPQDPSPSRREFDIAVLDGKSVARELTRLLQQRPIKDLPARVKIVENPRQAADAEILYIGPDYAGKVADAVKSLAGRPVLIVTDTARGLDDGSAVNFMLVDRRVRFEVSLPAAQSAGIKVSSQLLSVATRVRGSRLYRWTSCAPWLSEARTHPVCVERMAGS